MKTAPNLTTEARTPRGSNFKVTLAACFSECRVSLPSNVEETEEVLDEDNVYNKQHLTQEENKLKPK